MIHTAKVLAVSFLLAILGVTACGAPGAFEGPDREGGSVAIHGTLPSDGTVVNAALQDYGILRAEAIITGPDITSPITSKISISEMVLSGQLFNIPAGRGRQLTINAYRGNETSPSCSGSTIITVLQDQTVQASLILQCALAATAKGNLGLNVSFNTPPVIESAYADAKTIEIGGSVTLSVSASDPDGDNLSYLWSSADGSFNPENAADTIWTAPLVAGEYLLTVTVSDDRQGETSLDISIVVTDSAGGTGRSGGGTGRSVSPTYAWRAMTSNTTATLNGVSGRSASDVYAVGNNGAILHWDGSSWSSERSGAVWSFLAAWSSPAATLAVGRNGVVVENGGGSWRFKWIEPGLSYRGVWGADSGEVFVVGSFGLIRRFSGSSSESMSINSFQVLNAVWGSSAGDVFAVGEGGEIAHYDGISWSPMNSITRFTLYGLWGTSASDVFAVGEGGAILHYDGASWSSMNSNTAFNLYGVWGAGASDVFAVGEGGVIVHYDGVAWSPMTSNTLENLQGVWGAGAGDVFAVGAGGVILHYSAQ